MTSAEIRKHMQVFDTFFNRVSKKAALRDTGYSIHSPEDLASRVVAARIEMSRIANVTVPELPYIHTGENGRFDCENYGILGSYILKLQHDADCRKMGLNEEEYAIFPVARYDMPHTQALCLTDDDWRVVEFITGEIFTLNKLPKFKVYWIG